MVEKAWGGRFDVPPSEEMARFSASLHEDRQLVREDVLGSLAHVRALARAGVLTGDEARTLADGLRGVLSALESGEATLDVAHEDVHMGVEALLTARLGAVAGKLHTARSRNDQVATDLRLWTRRQLLDFTDAALALAAACLDHAAAHASTPMPGFTHLQPAQPVTVGHHFHAHAARALRDAARALDAYDRVNVSPLGAGALAGTSFPLDPAATARDLGFDEAFANSLDAVSDRDFAAEAAFVAALAFTHLAGLAEELVLWSSPRFGFVTLPEAYTTGSSIMPQKRNPDAAEIVRGQAGRAVGDVTALLATLKGLPLAYNRDLQEAKAPLLAALPRAVAALRVTRALVAGLTVNAGALLSALADGHPEATEVADHVTRRGVPFREAHHVTGRLVKEAERRGVRLKDFTLDELRAFWEGFDASVRDVLDPARAADAKTTPGGTAPARVTEAVDAARARLKAAADAAGARRARVDAAEAALLGGDAGRP